MAIDPGEEYQLKIIQKLTEGGFIKPENREKFTEMWRETGKHVTSVILDENDKNPAAFMNEMDLLQFISKITGCVSYDPKFVTMDSNLVENMCYLLYPQTQP